MYVFCSLTNRPTSQVSHILDTFSYRQSSQKKNQKSILNSSRRMFIFYSFLQTTEQTVVLNYREALLLKRITRYFWHGNDNLLFSLVNIKQRVCLSLCIYIVFLLDCFKIFFSSQEFTSLI